MRAVSEATSCCQPKKRVCEEKVKRRGLKVQVGQSKIQTHSEARACDSSKNALHRLLEPVNKDVQSATTLAIRLQRWFHFLRIASRVFHARGNPENAALCDCSSTFRAGHMPGRPGPVVSKHIHGNR